MLKFLKPTIGLPVNFLRTAFQTGTGLYHKEDSRRQTPIVAQIAAEALGEVYPTRMGGISTAISEQRLTAEYFLNEKGGMVISCQYDDPSLFHLNRKSALLLIGTYSPKSKTGKYKAPDLTPYFALLGEYTKEALDPDRIKIFAANDSNHPTGIAYKKHEKTSSFSLTIAFSFADKCFKSILSNTPLNPSAINKDVDSLGPIQLLTMLGQMKNRTLPQLETQIAITQNLALPSSIIK